MKTKTVQTPLKFIVLFLALFLVHGTQAQSSCNSAIVVQINSADTFYIGSSELWLRFQATSETVIFDLVTEGVMPHAQIADLGIYSGSCEELVPINFTTDSLNINYVSDLVINDYYYIKVTQGDSSGLFVLSLIESTPIQVYFDFDCVPECDNIVFNWGFETVFPWALIPTCSPQSTTNDNGLWLDPFNIQGVLDNCPLVTSPAEIYSHMVCNWKKISISPQIRIQNNSKVAYMYRGQTPTPPEAIAQRVFMKESTPYTIDFDFATYNALANSALTGLTSTVYIYGSTTPNIAFDNPTNILICTVSGNTNTWTNLFDYNGFQPYVYTPPVGNNIYGIIIYPEHSIYPGSEPYSSKNHLLIDNIKITPPPPLECPIISGPEVVCPGTTSVSFTITNYDPVYVYQYSVNGGPIQIATSSTIIVDLTGISGNEINLLVQNWCECFGDFYTIISCELTGMDYTLLDNDVITQAQFSNQKIFICGDVEIGANVSFNDNCELYFAPNSKLTLQQGYSLTIDNSLLTDACLKQWSGIFANHNNSAVIIQNNCTMKHALHGIVSSDGAPLDITNSAFINNTTAIKIRQYDQYCPETVHPSNPPPPTTPHPAYFSGNVFSKDQQVTFPGLSGPFTGIMIDTVFQITIGDYTIQPSIGRNTFINLDFGIKISNSSVYIYNNLFENIANGTQIPNYHSLNDQPLEGAVYAWSLLLPSIPPFSTQTPPSPPPSTTCIQKHITVGGLYQYQPNEFISCNIGVYSDRFRINCDGNIFDDHRFNAVYSVEPGSQSTVRSNTITQVPGLWAVDINNHPKRKFDAAISLANAYQMPAGKFIEINSNEIYHAKTGISLTNITSSIIHSSTQKVFVNGNQIFFSNVDNADNYWHGIRLEGCNRINVGGNEIESSESGDAGAAAENVIGIYVSSTAFASIRDNMHLKKMYSGIFVVGNCLGTQFFCNDFKWCKYGFYFKPSIGGAATMISDQWPIFQGANFPSDNAWFNQIDDNERLWGDLNIAAGSVKWYHRYANNSSTVYGPNINAYPTQHPLFSKIEPEPFTTGNSPCIGLPYPIDDNDWDGALRNARLGEVVREEIEYAELVDEFEYFDQQYVYELLYANPDIMYLGTDDDTAYINFYNYMTNSTIAEMTNINELIENGDINQALMENGVFVASNLIENNMQVINEIYLNSIAQYLPFDSVQRDALMAIAMLTPYLGGNAVYSARVMLGIDPRDYNLHHRFAPERDLLDNGKVTNLRVYPNPVHDNLTIEILDGMKDGTLFVELHSLMGKRVLISSVEISSSIGNLNISGIAKGLYLLLVKCEKGSYKSTKILIH